jgi:hypothetical protein
VERNEYIDSFFANIKSQLSEATIESRGRSVRYKDLIVAAKWNNELWDIQLNNDSEESIQRHYDPLQARSPEAAASYFVDALLRMSGEEPIPRPQVLRRPLRKAAETRSTG